MKGKTVKGMLDLEVTRRCNLRCDYCFVGWSRGWTADMPRETAMEIIAEGQEAFSTLHLTGGEPFAYDAVFELIDEGLRCGYERVVINTNGTMITSERLARLAARAPRVSLTVSLDGPEHLHDPVRGPGRFQQALACLNDLHAKGVEAQVMTVVTQAVLGELFAFVQSLYAAAPGLHGLTLFPVGVGHGGSQKPGAALHPLSPEELHSLCLTVAVLDRLGHRVGIGAYPIVNPLLAELGYPPDRLYQCAAGRGRICVHADLSVSTCHPVKDPVYGVWRPGLLRQLGAFPEHRRIAARDYDGGRSCQHKEICGHCRAYVTAAGHGFYGNDGICDEVLADYKHALPRATTERCARPSRVRLPIAQ